MEGFHDQEALEALSEQITEVLRPLGITTDAEQGIQYGIQGGQMMVMIMGMVRPQARERAEEDKATKAEFNQMMAENNRLMQEQKKEEIAGLTEDPDALMKWLFENQTDCEHENVQEGLCLDCQQEVGD